MPGYKDPPKETQFTSTNQPSPEKKRVPKYRTRFKKFIENNIDIVNDKMKDGNISFWLMAFERAYGKEKDIVKYESDNEMTEEELDEIIAEKINKINESRKD